MNSEHTRIPSISQLLLIERQHFPNFPCVLVLSNSDANEIVICFGIDAGRGCFNSYYNLWKHFTHLELWNSKYGMPEAKLNNYSSVHRMRFHLSSVCPVAKSINSRMCSIPIISECSMLLSHCSNTFVNRRWNCSMETC